jgi:hypothetical protein
MKSRIGDYAYEVTNELRAETEADRRWGYMVYRIMPVEVLLSHGEDSLDREHAERNARQIIALFTALDRMGSEELSA